MKQLSFQVFPEGCDKGTVSFLEEERIPKISTQVIFEEDLATYSPSPDGEMI